MKKLYFDYNIVNRLSEGLDSALITKYESIAHSHIVVFSPAHLEEIAVSEKRFKVESRVIDEKIQFLTKIAQRNALRPITRDELLICDESPIDCYKRVIENYENNDLAELIEALIISDANQNPAGNPLDRNNEKPEDILNHMVYREHIALWLLNNGVINKDEIGPSLKWQFSDLEKRFSVFEGYVNLAANLLEKIGYYREREEKSRSRLHDVSHIIYGAYCDIFVSADKKLIKKTRAIYSMLGIPTKVLHLQEFYTF